MTQISGISADERQGIGTESDQVEFMLHACDGSHPFEGGSLWICADLVNLRHLRSC